MPKWFKRKKKRKGPSKAAEPPELEQEETPEVEPEETDDLPSPVALEPSPPPAEIPLKPLEPEPGLPTQEEEVAPPTEAAAAVAAEAEAEAAAPVAKPPKRRWFRRRKAPQAPVEATTEVELPQAEVAAAAPEEADEALRSAEPEPALLIPSEPEPEQLTPEEEVPPADLGPPEAEEEAEEVEPGEEPKKKGVFRRLRARLGRTRGALATRLDRLFLGKKVIDAELLDELEELLITADLGVETSLALLDTVREKVRRKELRDPLRLKAHLKAEMVAMLNIAGPSAPVSDKPRVIIMIGVNGVGKTTTIAKLAHYDRAAGQKVLLVAADTFRAAAIEQLEVWGHRVEAEVIKQKSGADPAAVVFDGLAAARSRNIDTVYIDTAGRLHTKVNLMEELKKIKRTVARQLPEGPQETYLVLDATTGQNAISQARMFHESLGVTGLIITKLDGTAKGGVALGVVKETGLPLRYIGVGEGMEDLRPFEAEAFVEAILG